MDELPFLDGPWNYGDTAGSHQYAIYEEKNGRDIAYVINRDEKSEATARVMSKAADLYEALRVSMVAVERLAKNHDPDQLGMWMACFNHARDVMRQVEQSK